MLASFGYQEKIPNKSIETPADEKSQSINEGSQISQEGHNDIMKDYMGKSDPKDKMMNKGFKFSSNDDKS